MQIIPAEIMAWNWFAFSHSLEQVCWTTITYTVGILSMGSSQVEAVPTKEVEITIEILDLYEKTLEHSSSTATLNTSVIMIFYKTNYCRFLHVLVVTAHYYQKRPFFTGKSLFLKPTIFILVFAVMNFY